VTTAFNTLDAVSVRSRCSGKRSFASLHALLAGGCGVASAWSFALCWQFPARPTAFIYAPGCVARDAAFSPHDADTAAPGNVVGSHPAVEVLPFVAADALSAGLLYRLSRVYSSSKGRAAADGGCWGCTLLFLWNPCSIAACVGCVFYRTVPFQLDRLNSCLSFLAGEAGVHLT